MILSAIAEKLKRRSKDDFKGRHFEASLILQAVSCICAVRLGISVIHRAAYARVCDKLRRAVLSEKPTIQLASPAEGIGDGEHEEFGERDTLDQEKCAVSAEYP